MSSPILKPTFLAGTPRYSGAVQDGFLNMQQGGLEAYSRMSGLLTDVMIQSGGGRLNRVTLHQQLVSGAIVIFYDAHAVTSGLGATFASGHKILGVLGNGWAAASGVNNLNALVGTTLDFQMPFFSGLCVTQTSGQPGWTASFTRQVNTLDRGNQG